MAKAAAPDQWKVFASAFVKLANATKAAIAAGYSEKSASVQGSRLLRQPKVQEYINAQFMHRRVAGERIFQDMMEICTDAVDFARKIKTEQGVGPAYLVAAEAAMRQMERIWKVPGVMPEQVPVDDAEQAKLIATMQELVKRIPQYTPARVIDAPPALEAPKNGNGHSNGNGDSWHAMNEGENGH